MNNWLLAGLVVSLGVVAFWVAQILFEPTETVEERTMRLFQEGLAEVDVSLSQLEDDDDGAGAVPSGGGTEVHRNSAPTPK